MTDNARIGSAIEFAIHALHTNGGAPCDLSAASNAEAELRVLLDDRASLDATTTLLARARKERDTVKAELATAKDREAELTKALAEAQADLERAREDERERIIGIITDPHNNILWAVPGSSRVQAIHADPRMIRAALAPEQKGE